MLKFLAFMLLSGSVFAEMNDPTFPFEGSYLVSKGVKTVEKKPELQAILISGEEKIAIINGKVVKEGEVVSEMKVIKIQSTEVELNGKKGTVKINLYGPSIFRPLKESQK